ncbi:hypothetical protein GQ53DRAFT_847721 [Thozetella sp. PMI_491]|nr:hypothetical protein GQ53DRAFT_847721 [Thozetella sp. PMI_491]
MLSPEKLTFRLRRCPATHDEDAVAILLSGAFPDIEPDDVWVQSLATTVYMDLGTKEGPTKTATLMFQKIPSKIGSDIGQNKNEWRLRVERQVLILDTHFLGLTPLSDAETDHQLDCITISGLGSHPFGSWQPKGDDRSFMWIRDAMPAAVPNLRAILYGYNAAMDNSESFQSITDIALSFIESLKALTRSASGNKPFIFLAHSLGGIILKEAVAALANSTDELERDMLKSRFRGGVLFGVPSRGMETTSLRAMVAGLANEQIVLDLTEESEYLRSLDDRFTGIAAMLKMSLFWAYETKTSPTVEKQQNGSWARTGPQKILVTRDSATQMRYSSGHREACIFPINENHSDMVKFQDDDVYSHTVFSKLASICRAFNLDSSRTSARAAIPVTTLDIEHLAKKDGKDDTLWTVQELIRCLKAPDRDSRLESIEHNFEHTFEWVFDDNITAFPEWLRSGRGVFWIHGKPGSGKSTLMKYIWQGTGCRLREIMHDPSTGSVFIQASFFFHHRGTLQQKSFKGLLQGILSQILSQHSNFPFLEAVVDQRARTGRPLVEWTENELEQLLHSIIQQDSLDIQLFLLLDALDEYDGNTSYIARFLKALVGTKPPSRTQLKILFSSRPWDKLLDELKDSPSIQLQDYTKDDILEYCVGNIQDHGSEIAAILEPLIPDMVYMAHGVFLWVRLVVEQLLTAASEGHSMPALREILHATPSDLKDFYATLIKRIPPEVRMDTYVIMEIVSFGELYDDQIGWDRNRLGDFDLLDLICVLLCSRCETYQECVEALAEVGESIFLAAPANHDSTTLTDLGHDRTSWFFSWESDKRWRSTRKISLAALERYKRRILAATGGVVEFLHRGEDSETTTGGDKELPRVQLVHQTVKEFVRQGNYKQLVLGRRAKTTGDNRYSYLARYFLAAGNGYLAGKCLRRVEATTGQSHSRLIGSVPPGALHHRFRWNQWFETWDPGIAGPLRFAVVYDLLLYLEDALGRDPDAFRSTRERLLVSNFHDQFYSITDYSPGAHGQVVRLLLSNGYNVRIQDHHNRRQFIDEANLTETARYDQTVVQAWAAQFRHLLKRYS